MRIRARKRYWLAIWVALVGLAVPTSGIILLLLLFLWKHDKSLALAAYKQERLSLPRAWYDGFLKWGFEKVNDTHD